jgi:hypothetical protein
LITKLKIVPEIDNKNLIVYQKIKNKKLEISKSGFPSIVKTDFTSKSSINEEFSEDFNNNNNYF